MNATTEQVFVEALSLPEGARSELALRLLTSLEDDSFSPEHSVLWSAEIKQRRADFVAGRAREVSVEEALRRAEAALA